MSSPRKEWTFYMFGGAAVLLFLIAAVSYLVHSADSPMSKFFALFVLVLPGIPTSLIVVEMRPGIDQHGLLRRAIVAMLLFLMAAFAIYIFLDSLPVGAFAVGIFFSLSVAACFGVGTLLAIVGFLNERKVANRYVNMIGEFFAPLSGAPLLVVSFFCAAFLFVTISLGLAVATNDKYYRLRGDVPSISYEKYVEMQGLSNLDCRSLRSRYPDQLVVIDRLESGEIPGIFEQNSYPKECSGGGANCRIWDVALGVACYSISLEDSEYPLILKSLHVQGSELNLEYFDNVISTRAGKCLQKPLDIDFDPDLIPRADWQWNKNSVVFRLPEFGSVGYKFVFAEPELLDYFYFMVYTITTTGYGDMRPTRAFTKFTTISANLYEVLFCVVFFNALSSFVARRPAS